MFLRSALPCIGRFLLLGGLLLPLTSCGGGGGGGGGGGVDYDYGISLTPDKTSVAPGGTINLNVKYDAPKSNSGITWSMICPQADCGSVSSGGIYTAPAKVDAQMKVGIKAKSNDKPAQGYYVEIWVTGKIVVELQYNSPVVPVAETIQFIATVNSPDASVSWQVNGAAGGDSTVGTISTAGLYTAPATVPSPDTVTITAIAHCDQATSASAELQILPPPQITVLVSPLDQSIGVNATLQFTATVQNATDTAVQWQVNGVAGGNSTVGTISSSGLYTAPAAIPNPAAVTVSAVSHADATKSGSTHVTIVNLKNSLLSGPYSFEIAGPDSNEEMRAALGSITFDGKGSLTGLLDLNQMTMPAGAETSIPFSGTYMVGQDNRGTLTFSFSPALAFAFTLNDSANDARLIEYDTRGTHYTGSMQKQTPADFALSKLVGDYAFSVYGVSSLGLREVAIGRFHANGAGVLSDATVDLKEGAEDGQTLSNMTGTLAITDSAHGRGIITFIESSTSQFHFSLYMTNASDVFLLSTDAVPSDNPLLVGRAISQSGGPFSNASLSGPVVFGLWGDGITSPHDSCLVVGEWTATSSTQSLAGLQDIHCDTSISSQPWTATYTIAANGRGQMGGGTQMANVLYMIAPNKAFLLNSVGPEALIGTAEPQQVSSFSNTLFNGTYRIAPISMPKPDADISQGFLTADGSGNLTGTEDILGSELLTFTFAGTYSVDNTGRTVITFVSPEVFHYAAYPISSTRFMGISIEPGDSLANLVNLEQ